MDEENVEFHKPKDKNYNRRSSLFSRRSLALNCGTPPTAPDMRATLPAQPSDSVRAEEESKRQYLGLLQKEEEDWKNLIEQKRKQEEELTDKCPQAAPSDAFLTDEDKKFLNERPDYAGISRLLDTVTEAVALKQRRITNTMAKLNNFLTLYEKITLDAADSVIENFMENFDEFGPSPPAD